MNKPLLSISLLLILASTPGTAELVYQYRQPGGGLLFTDKDIMPTGYTLLDVRKGWEYQPRRISENTRDRYDHFITLASRSFFVDPGLIKAVIHAESHFDTEAVSRAGAQGLMQLMPKTASFLEVYDTFDPQQNIMGGTRYLSYLTGKFDETALILAAYNAGEGNVRRHGGIPPFPETQAYVRKVLELLPNYQQQFAVTLNSQPQRTHHH